MCDRGWTNKELKARQIALPVVIETVRMTRNRRSNADLASDQL